MVAVLVLVVALIILSLVAVATVANGTSVAHGATTGEHAVVQANSGVSDALFHIDQMGEDVQPFCVGTPPSGMSMPAGVTSCLPALADAVTCPPRITCQLYYAAQPISTTNVGVTSVARVGNQTRTENATIYRVLNGFGIYGLVKLTWTGNFGMIHISEVDSTGKSVGPSTGTVAVGIENGGIVNCGNGSVTNLKFVGGPATNFGNCSPTAVSPFSATPQAATVCAAYQTSTVFAPCINTTNFALEPAGAPNAGSRYCPLPGISNLVAGVHAYVPSTLPQSAVYDCDTAGASVTLSAASTDKIPSGSYYLTGNVTTIGPIDPAATKFGPVSLFVIPAACSSAGCAPATSSSPSPTSGCNSTTPPSVGLTLLGPINGTESGKGSNQVLTAPNGPSLSLYWGGCGAVGIGSGSNAAAFAGNLYVPGGVISDSGGQFQLIGSIVIGTYTTNGAPNFSFSYPSHQTQVLQNWTITDYRITA